MGKLDSYWENTGGVWAQQNVTRENNPARTKRRVDTAKMLVALANNCEEPSILEVGCNYAENLRLIQAMDSDIELTGIDVSPEGIEMAKKRTNNIDLHVMHAGSLKFPDNKFSMVFTMGVMIHVHPDDARAVFDHIERVSARYICHVELATDEHFAKSNKITTRAGKPMQYIFLHDYKSAHAEAGYRIIDEMYVGENLTRIIYEKLDD
jgi:SAM-dependent methyltransferase